ncbi:hypothetical protein UF00_040650, partial [Burkholderia cenocepacia]
ARRELLLCSLCWETLLWQVRIDRIQAERKENSKRPFLPGCSAKPFQLKLCRCSSGRIPAPRRSFSEEALRLHEQMKNSWQERGRKESFSPSACNAQTTA